MSKVQRKCLVEGCNDFGQYKGYQGTSATKYYSNYCYGHDRASDRPAPKIEADKELDEMLGKYSESIKDLAHYIFIEGKIPEVLERPDGINLKTALLAWRDKALEKEKLMRLAAEIREGELEAKLEPFEKFAAHIKAIMEIKES